MTIGIAALPSHQGDKAGTSVPFGVKRAGLINMENPSNMRGTPSFSSRSSLSSASSCDSSGLGRRSKRGSFSHKRAQRIKSRSCQAITVPTLAFCGGRTRSSPYMRNDRARKINSSASKRNDEWDDFQVTKTKATAARSSLLTLPHSLTSPDLLAPKIKAILKKNRAKKNTVRSVRFSAKAPIELSTLHPDDREWYNSAELDQFSKDAKDSADVIRRVMAYAAPIDDTYSRTLGLSSPSVLKDYLMNPQEVVGVEHLLSGQSVSRSRLTLTYKMCLFAEQARQRDEGFIDVDKLAKMLQNTSVLLSDMAKERADYVAELD